jgi:hypothetical protein
VSNNPISYQSKDIIKDLSASSPVAQAATVLETSYPSYVTVNLNGSHVPALCAGGQFPAVGDSVMVLQIGTLLICMGAIPKPAHGIVVSAASEGRVSVEADDGQTYSLNYNHLYTPAVNDHVKIDWDLIGGFVVGPLAAAPTGDPHLIVPTGPGGSEGSGGTTTVAFNPTDSGTWNGSSYFTTQVYCGDTTLGAYFYGTQIADTIPDGAVINAIAVFVDETTNYYPGSLATFGLHSLPGRSGAPNPSSPVPIAAGSGWKNLPLSFGDALKTGAAFGLATDHGGYHIFAPKGVGNSGALSITWTV